MPGEELQESVTRLMLGCICAGQTLAGLPGTSPGVKGSLQTSSEQIIAANIVLASVVYQALYCICHIRVIQLLFKTNLQQQVLLSLHLPKTHPFQAPPLPRIHPLGKLLNLLEPIISFENKCFP